MARRLPLVLLCASIAALLGTGQALAKTIEPYAYSGNQFNGVDSPPGAFANVDNIAVDEVSGAVYVLDIGHGGVLRKFNANGLPVPFSAPYLGGATSITLGLESSPDIAVDNSGTPSQGNVYVFQGGFDGLIYGFDQSGTPLEKWPACGGACGNVYLYHVGSGLAVGLDGRLWIGNRTTSSAIRSTLNAIDPASAMLVPPKLLLPRDPFRFAIYGDGGFLLAARGAFGGFNEVQTYDADGELVEEALDAGPATAVAVDRGTDLAFVDRGDGVNVYDRDGVQVDSFGPLPPPLIGVSGSRGLAVNPTTGRAYLSGGPGQRVAIFDPGPAVIVPDVVTEPAVAIGPTAATLKGTLDPDGGGDTTLCQFEWGTSRAYGSVTPCAQGHVHPSAGGPQAVSAPLAGLEQGERYYFRLVTDNAAGPQQGGANRTFHAASPPAITNVAVTDVNTDTATVTADVNPEGGEVSYEVELGTTPAYGTTVPAGGKTPLCGGLPCFPPGTLEVRHAVFELSDLEPDTTYYYRVVATNDAGTMPGPDRSFHTFEFVPSIGGECPNALARQQTGAAQLRDCRAYELVSAADAGGFDVVSDLVEGQVPFGGYPRATDPPRALYAVHDGGIPGSGNPTNRGPDPYVATRGPDRWTTKYVGIPSNGTPSLFPFSSTLAVADTSLETFAFGGPEICDPCFGDNSVNVPLRLPDGSLVKGMAGSLDPGPADPAGDVLLSADGSHLVFATTTQLEPAGNDNGTDATVYSRDLEAGTTQVVSTLPGAVALDVSADGSRVLIGRPVSTDAAGNRYVDLYMHAGPSAGSIPIADTASGVLYGGMSADGAEVYFTTPDQLGADGDLSADLFRAEVDGTTAAVTAVTATDSDACDPVPATGLNNWNAVGAASANGCGAVAIGGGGGVASGSGDAYFLSPEQLDGSEGTLNQPNLYRAGVGDLPQFVATLEPNNPLVRNGVADSEQRDTADFQVTPDGARAAFASVSSLTGYENRGHAQVFGFDEATGVACISCNPSNAPATGPAGLASRGLSLADDGRVFFNSVERLVLRDANKRRDVYQWSAADGVFTVVELVSTGNDPHDSSLLTASADGTDVLFFTRQTLVEEDLNGPVVKLYDARSGGGFFRIPDPHPCKASDECHGPGSVSAPPAPIRTVGGTPGQFEEGPARKRCGKGKVRRKGKCVKKPKPRAKRGVGR